MKTKEPRPSTPGPRSNLRWHREPLLHFALLGAGIFLLYGWRQPSSREAGADDRPVISVSAGTLQSLTERWAKQFNRWPTSDEVRGLIDEQVREDVLYREALAMGLDRDDAIVRRRLAQKMEFVIEDVAAPAEPDEGELARWFESHAGRYLKPARLSLRHVYFSRERRGAAAEKDALSALATTRLGGPSDEVTGDPALFETEMRERSEQAVTDIFGAAFTAGAVSAPIGSWVGPVESPYGFHLMKVSARTERSPPVLSDVRDAVLRDFQDEKREETNRGIFERLLARYRIEVAAPPGGGVAPAEAIK